MRRRGRKPASTNCCATKPQTRRIYILGGQPPNRARQGNAMKRIKDMVAEANAQVSHAPATEMMALHGQEDVLFVDLRDPRELERDGMIPGAFHCPRGLLEFWIDPESQYHNPSFAEDKRFVFYCNLGWRSALAADIAQKMGLVNVCHIDGGFEAWKAAGGAVEEKK